MIAFARKPHPNALDSTGRCVRIVDAANLLAEPEAWDDLVARAVEPHPHFSRHVIAAHAAAGLLPADVAFVTVRSDDRLDAVLPFRTGFDVTGFGRAVSRPFLSPFMPSSAPLVAADDPEVTLGLLVAGLAEASGGRVWRWPLLTTSGRVGQGLLAAWAQAGWTSATAAAFERPMLDRRPSQDAFLKNHPHKSRLKDNKRRHRRLAEAGALRLETASEGEALSRAVETFLDIEASGWKGEAGTAMLCGPRTLALARALFAETCGPVSVRADSLTLDGRPLAISLALVAGRTVCFLKTAFDERERAHSPGLLLEAEIVRVLHETAFADRLDSATLAGSVLENFWTERETVAEIVAVPPGGDGLISIERRVALARFEHRARQEARRLLKRR